MKRRYSVWSSISPWLRDIMIAVVLVITITTFIKPTIVCGASMTPNLQDGDYLLISKQAYRFDEPKRNQIVVFPVEEENKLYIKRGGVGFD